MRALKITLFIIAVLLLVALEIHLLDRPNDTTRERAPEASGRYAYQDGTMQDRQTRLTWIRCSAGQKQEGDECTGKPGRYAWNEARAYCAQLATAGHKDWRLPTRDELRSVINCRPSALDQCDAHARLDEEGRQRCRLRVRGADAYWSSSGPARCYSARGKSRSCAGIVRFYRVDCGYSGDWGLQYVENRNRVRCVRP